MKHDKLRRHDDMTTASLISTLPLLVHTGFLDVADVGKLGSTCSDMRSAALDEEIWVPFCARRFPNTCKLPRSIIQAKGHRWVLQQRLRRGSYDRLHKPPALPQARCIHPNLSPEKLIILVDVSVGGQSRISEALPGDFLFTLFDHGVERVPLESKAKLGQLTMDDRGFFRPTDTLERDLDVSVHLVDLQEERICCIIEKESIEWSKCNFYIPPEGLQEENIDWKAHREYGRMSVFGKSLPLTPAGEALTGKLPNFDGLRFALEFKVLYPKSACYHGFPYILSKFRQRQHTGRRETFHYFVEDYWKKNKDCPEREVSFLKAETAAGSERQLETSSLEIFACSWQHYASVYQSKREAQEHGVTLLNLLEQLQGWEAC